MSDLELFNAYLIVISQLPDGNRKVVTDYIRNQWEILDRRIAELEKQLAEVKAKVKEEMSIEATNDINYAVREEREQIRQKLLRIRKNAYHQRNTYDLSYRYQFLMDATFQLTVELKTADV